MAKQNPESMEHNWDTGIYRTGSIKAPRGSSGLVAVLLVAVIFLGGIASAMGIINIRLLAQLQQENQSTVPLDVGSPASDTDTTGSTLSNNNTPEPTLPADRNVTLSLQSALYADEKAAALDAQAIAALAKEAMVTVYSLSYFNDNITGSGIVLTENGFILTNAHTVQSAKKIFVYTADGNLLRAALVGTDPYTDLAVLYVDATGLIPAALGNSDSVRTGDTVYSIVRLQEENMPAVLGGAVTDHACTLATQNRSLPVLQTSFQAENGPVFDAHGQIIGINTQKVGGLFGYAGEDGLVLPSTLVVQIAEALIRQGYVTQRPDLGMEVDIISELYQHYWDLPGGLLLTHVDADSSAARLGLQEGDILMALNCQRLSSLEDLYRILNSAEIGQELTAVIYREEQKFTVTLTVAEVDG